MRFAVRASRLRHGLKGLLFDALQVQGLQILFVEPEPVTSPDQNELGGSVKMLWVILWVILLTIVRAGKDAARTHRFAEVTGVPPALFFRTKSAEAIACSASKIATFVAASRSASVRNGRFPMLAIV
jgi:hypothetical protein